MDCNTCGGAFALAGQTLTVGPSLACTRAACPTMAFENTYTGVLSGGSTVTLSSGTLGAVVSAWNAALRALTPALDTTRTLVGAPYAVS